MNVIEYKCPNCGSGMVFDSEKGTLSCNYCGRQDEIEGSLDPLGQRQFVITSYSIHYPKLYEDGRYE